jgi:L-2-hydroxycarboxylate dehydrogenase (NAD+)
MTLVDVKWMREVIDRVLLKFDVPSDERKIVADSILHAHQTGKDTHGISRLPIYVKKIKNGSLLAKVDIEVIRDTPVIKTINGNHGFGQVIADYAMQDAIEKARNFGIGIVGVRKSNNFGTIAYFLEQCTKQHMISIVMTNAAPAISPWGGEKAIFGTNPIGFGFPTPKPQADIIFDMATTVAARGKIRLAAKNQSEIPLGWALDENGFPTTDPVEALKGTLLPIGGHKGAGLSMMIDLFSGLLTGADFAGAVKPLNTDGEHSGNGHFFMVLNPMFFMNKEEYEERITHFIQTIKASSQGSTVFYPGERAHKRRLERQINLDLSEKVYSDILTLLTDLNIVIKPADDIK